MIAIADILLAILLLGPKPPWWKFVQRAKWRRGLRIIEEAAKAYERQQRRPGQWTGRYDPGLGRLVADDKEVN